MASTVTIETLIADTRRWADIRTSTPTDAHETDTDIMRLLNLKLAEFWEMLTGASATAFAETEVNVTITSGSGNLPADFFRLNRAWIAWSTTDHESMTNIGAAQDAALYQGSDWTRGAPKAFRIVGSTIKVFPPATSATVRIAYVPAFASLVALGSTDGVNGWEKYVTMGVAIELLAIEKRSNPELAQLYLQQEARVRSMAEERQAQDAPMIRDVGWGGINDRHRFDPGGYT